MGGDSLPDRVGREVKASVRFSIWLRKPRYLLGPVCALLGHQWQHWTQYDTQRFCARCGEQGYKAAGEPWK
jgi:hypothetical protein